MSDKTALIACEESQAVTIELRKRGIAAFSCDIEPCSGGHPEWHLMCDVSDLLQLKWDMIIAFPPCTDLAVSGAAWFEQKRKDGSQQRSIDFFMQFANLDHVPLVGIENPIGIMSRLWRKPDQIIQPWQFGHPHQKSTCLWLKGLPLLIPTKIVDKGAMVTYADGTTRSAWFNQYGGKSKKTKQARSKTFPGIAEAMADQWSKIL